MFSWLELEATKGEQLPDRSNNTPEVGRIAYNWIKQVLQIQICLVGWLTGLRRLDNFSAIAMDVKCHEDFHVVCFAP